MADTRRAGLTVVYPNTIAFSKKAISFHIPYCIHHGWFFGAMMAFQQSAEVNDFVKYVPKKLEARNAGYNSVAGEESCLHQPLPQRILT